MTETTTTETVTPRRAARAELRHLFPRGSRVPVLVTHVARSGMSRDIAVLAPVTVADSTVGGTTDRPTVRNVSHLLRQAGIGTKPRDGSRAVRVDGCGMDMTFHLVYTLSQTLYGPDAGYSLTADNLT